MKKNVFDKTEQIIAETISAMRELTVYRDEFLPVIRRYAYVRCDYETALTEWQNDGGVIVCERQGANGYTSEGLNPKYKAVKQLRDELAQFESRLGLDPAGLKKIKDAELKSQKKTSRFEEALNSLGK